MNLHLHHVVSDIIGVSGLRILEPDPAAYQLKVQKTILAKIQKQAAALGYKLLPTALVPA